MLHALGHCAAPEELLRQEFGGGAQGRRKPREFCFTFDLRRHWLDDSPLRLGVACAPVAGFPSRSRLAITDRDDALAALGRADSSFDAFCRAFELPVIELPAALRLHTHAVAKPWGEEIWYTGIERRGVCLVEGVPLPWLLALGHPHALARPRHELLLLKILAPHPGEVEGDLYFEMHREKVEVYVITGIDPLAWPGGRGRIRLGFAPEVLAQFADRDAFESAWLDAVRRYRETRVAIDRELDRLRAHDGIAPNEVVPVATSRAWQAQIPAPLREQERARRTAMERFYGVRELSIGDVVQVTPGTPHSLQHGVRAVEFQTPHYERLILSFAQKVLTQTHWDTEEAAQEMTLSAPPPPELPIVASGDGVTVDRAAAFAEFEVQRIRLEPGAHYAPDIEDYGIAIGIGGVCRIAGREIRGEEALLVSAAVTDHRIENTGNGEALCLLATPK